MKTKLDQNVLILNFPASYFITPHPCQISQSEKLNSSNNRDTVYLEQVNNFRY